MAIGDVLWSPPRDALETSEIGRFVTWLHEERGRDLAGYDELWRWSVDDLEGFWAAIWDFFGIRAHAPYEQVLDAPRMPGARWFTGARLNYAEHLLGTDADTDVVAVVARSRTRGPRQLTFDCTSEQVARARAGLQRLGVGPRAGAARAGVESRHRVVAYLPNIPDTRVAFIATASLGISVASSALLLGS